MEQRRLHKKVDDLSCAYKEETERKRKEGASREDIDEIASLYHWETRQLEDEIIRSAHRYYMRLADRLLVPTPEYDTSEGGAWIESEESPGYVYLKPEALHDLRRRIRAEKQERFEGWLKWAAAITGLVGAFTGLVAVWKG